MMNTVPHTLESSPALESKLPKVGTTIFTVMSALAQEHKAVNLGQGFPDFNADPHLIDHVSQAMKEGLNQYPSMLGVLELRQIIADKIKHLYGKSYDPVQEITVTAGATQAILSAILCLVRAQDEVIVLEPCYDSYVPNIELAGGVAIPVALDPGTFRINFDRLSRAITPKTRAIVVNSPHNPSGTTWSEEDLQKLSDLLEPTGIFLISDEVYEHMVYAPKVHLSVSSYPQLAKRAFVISSFGKTFHVTGWKIAYTAAPQALTHEFRKVHQFNVFTVNTPMQHGLARFMVDAQTYLGLPEFYRAKRDLFRAGLERTRFELLPCEGTYFQCVSIKGLKGELAQMTESAFCEWLIKEIGVAAIPLSAFYMNGFDQGIVRFCFAKKEETLNLAIDRLSQI
jgi:methionine aminotransferase